MEEILLVGDIEMTNEKDLQKWREKLKPYFDAVEIKLYIEHKKIEDLNKLKEICKNGR